jgi:hypothetical protein
MLCKPLCLTSNTKWQTKNQGTMNESGQVPLQHHTTCVRYLHSSIAFPTPYTYMGVSLSENTDFLLAASISTLKITQPDVEGTESA